MQACLPSSSYLDSFDLCVFSAGGAVLRFCGFFGRNHAGTQAGCVLLVDFVGRVEWTAHRSERLFFAGHHLIQAVHLRGKRAEAGVGNIHRCTGVVAIHQCEGGDEFVQQVLDVAETLIGLRAR